MPIETTLNSIANLNAAWPTGADPKSDGDDHIRNIKSILKLSFPNFAGPMPVAHDQVASKADIANAQFSSVLPSQATNAGKFLYTDGTAASWQSPYATQTGNAGKFLVTDGVNATWSNALKASVIRFADGTDATKLAAFDLSGITTATTRTYTLPNTSGTLALLSDTATAMQVLASTTISTPVLQLDFLNIFTAAFDVYVIRIEGLVSSAANILNLALAKAGAVDSSAAYSAFVADGALQGSGQSVFNTGVSIPAAGATSAFVGSFEITNTNSATTGKLVTMIASATLNSYMRTASYLGTNTVTGFRLYLQGGTATLNGGTVRVYGIKNN